MGFCPFLSTRYYQIANIDQATGDITGSEITSTITCPQSNDCQIWDTINNRCGMLVSNTILSPTTTINNLLEFLETLIGIEGDARENFSKILEHVHNSHLHTLVHTNGAGYINTGGDPVAAGSSPPQAMTLMAEYFNNEDRDNISIVALQTKNPLITGSIFGFNFKITDDATCPPALSSIYKNPDFPTGKPEITWTQYKSLL